MKTKERKVHEFDRQSGRNELNVGYFSVWDSVWFPTANEMKKKKNEQEKQQKLSLDECLVCLTENSYAVYRDNQSLSLNAFDRNFTRITALINLIWLHKFIYGIIDAIDILESISLLC